MDLLPKIMQELDIVQDINKVLNDYDLSITYSDLAITDTNIVETIVKEKYCTFTGESIEFANFSKKIIEILFPSSSLKTVYHYTSKETAECIVNTGLFRLYNISKRIKESEVVSFCKAHELKNDNIMIPSTYYASFTSTEQTTGKENYLWSQFATHDGVRLKIKIVTNKPERTDILRKIYYEKAEDSKPISLLGKLAKVAKKYGKKFTLRGVSTICSYYLPKTYDLEEEYRILHRNIDERVMPVKVDEKGGEYIEIELGKKNDTGYLFEIMEVMYTTDIDIGDKYKNKSIKRSI